MLVCFLNGGSSATTTIVVKSYADELAEGEWVYFAGVTNHYQNG